MPDLHRRATVRSGLGPVLDHAVKHGIPTVTIGSGQAEIHTVKEYVRLDEFEKGCRLGVLMATIED